MKPVYLEFCGINSFSEPAKIDFKALLSGGLFGIFGDTGSGKSTILDSIHFALYGEIDRVPQSFNDCINYRSDAASVIFDFEIAAEGKRHTYRVKRERKRKNSATKAYLYEYGENGALNALAEGTRDVSDALEKIVGLTFEDFKTCIALPQGDFAALVKSRPAERVKLVARLFNLEKYGERLSVAVNAKYKQAEEAVEVVRAKMGENVGGGEAELRALSEKIETKKTLVAEAKKQLEEADAARKKAASLEQEKREYDALCTKLGRLKTKLPEMEEKRARLEKLPQANSVWEKATSLQKAAAERSAAAANAERAKAGYEQRLLDKERAKRETEEAGYEDKILETNLALQKLLGAETERAAAEKAKKELDACTNEYRVLRDRCPSEDFEGKKAAIEAELSALGEDESLLDYLKHNYKDVLTAETYGEIRSDLKRLAEKYPQTQADIEELLKKYTLSGGARTVDIATVNLAFKAAEQKRKTLKTQLDELEKRRRAYDDNEAKKGLLVEKGKLLRTAYETAWEKIAFLKDLGTEEELTRRLQALKAAQKKAREETERLQTEEGKLYAEWQKQQGLSAVHEESEKTLSKGLSQALENGGFETETQAFALVKEFGDGTAAKGEIKTFFDEYESCRRRVEETDGSKFDGYAADALESAEAGMRAARETLDGLNRELGAAERELKTLLEIREKYKQLEKELAEKEKYKNLCDELRLLVRGNRFLEYIASEYLQEICASASKTLLSLTGGRYFLRYDEKEFKVGDNLDGGNMRGVKTLSGGETFLVSLSLALSLSAAICMKSLRPIEFFFLDEGFGTLDEKLVDTVMDVLGKLSRTFSVGLISHVEELKHRIEQKILVTPASENHGSQVRTETF